MIASSANPIAGGPGRGAVRSDLSSAFGASAVSALRGGRTRRERRPRGVEQSVRADDEPGAVTSESPEPKPVEDDVQDSEDRRVSRAARPPRPATRRSSDAVARRRRFRVVRVRDRQDVDVLLLAVAKEEPASGSEFIDLVRERSSGVFVLAERTVYHELQRLRRNRLIRVTSSGGARRYLLTALGERVLSTRRRQWEAFARGFDGVLDAADDGDGDQRRFS